MSRYQVDKIIRQIANIDTARGVFQKDRGACLEAFDLTEEERVALLELNCPKFSNGGEK